ncbi:MAG: SDR family oxidoreductase, partial [Thermoanaerobaculia bacterium]
MSTQGPIPEELDPGRYIEKVSLITGEILDDPILPKQLLASNHRDYHVVDIQARHLMSRIVKATGDEELARQKMKRARRLGHKTSKVLAKVLGQSDPAKISKALFGLKEKEYYFRYKKHHHSRDEIDARLEELRREAAEKLAAVSKEGRLAARLLLTGGTGFVGQEFLWQAAHDDDIAEVVVLIRPKEVRHRKTQELIRVLSPAERGLDLLRRLWLEGSAASTKFRFIAGDVEQPGLGIDPEEAETLRQTLTHVIHCAACVAFDDPYEDSFRANVTGSLNALRFSESLDKAPGSPFVAHISIETSYIHGRQVKKPARDDEIVFPRNFYNHYYELTTAMASIETERFMLDKRLRIVQLCPSIVIGESVAGNNRGDTKVVNAPINVFGRVQQVLQRGKGRWLERTKASVLARMACIFPGDPSAHINLIPVDRVVQGMVAALKKPQAVGKRIHLVTDQRLASDQMLRIVKEELGLKVKLVEPTLHRNITLPMLTKLLTTLKQERVARALKKLAVIFGGYTEWGQPVHEVGNDLRILGLSAERPNTEQAFRMLCRHNKYVQDYGQIR